MERLSTGCLSSIHSRVFILHAKMKIGLLLLVCCTLGAVVSDKHREKSSSSSVQNNVRFFRNNFSGAVARLTIRIIEDKEIDKDLKGEIINKFRISHKKALPIYKDVKGKLKAKTLTARHWKESSEHLVKIYKDFGKSVLPLLEQLGHRVKQRVEKLLKNFHSQIKKDIKVIEKSLKN